MSEGAAGYTDLVPVFYGSYVEAVALRSALESYGFETFLPGENLKVIDPFVTGANALDVRLDAPVAVADEVKALIEELRPAPVEERMSQPGDRRRWWFLMLLVYLPLFIVLAPTMYLWRRFRRDPAGTPPGGDAARGSSPSG